MSSLISRRAVFLISSFFLGGSLGGLWETIWSLLRGAGVTWRSGIVFFPFCNPVYAAGALLMTLVAGKWGKGRRFLFSFAALGAVEYLFSFLEETVLGTRSWDYSSFPFNINGRVNLLYCLFFASLGLLWTDFALPRLGAWCRDNPRESALAASFLPVSYSFFCLLSLAGLPLMLDGLLSPAGMDLMRWFYPTIAPSAR